MQWIKFSERAPESGPIIYYDSKNDSILEAGVSKSGEISSEGYYCNNPECHWIYDDCGCYLIISPDDYWMPFPDKPGVSNE